MKYKKRCLVIFFALSNWVLCSSLWPVSGLGCSTADASELRVIVFLHPFLRKDHVVNSALVYSKREQTTITSKLCNIR